MAKRVVVHWVEMRTYEVPDDAPTNTYEEFRHWLSQKDDSGMYRDDSYMTDEDTRDAEIVEVERLIDVFNTIK